MQSQFDAVDNYIEGQKRRLNLPGAAVAIVEGDRMVHFRGFGVARPGGETPAANTPFYIGSLTKSFTALAVMQLAEAGQVGLDAPAQRYLPWFRVADAEISARITVRHLLNQTSGLPSIAGMAIPAGIDEHTQPIDRLKAILYPLRVSNPPGTKCSYCNLNYDLLGLIIEAVSGEAYSEYVQAHIFDPLEMSHSYARRAAAQQDGLAVGYRHWFGQPFPARHIPGPPGALPSGYLISCAEDMAHYLIAHLNGGRYGARQVLSSAGMDELQRGASDYHPMGIDSGRYAMGWFDEQIERVRVVSHGGNLPDFSAFMALLPEEKRGIVILTNADPAGLPPILAEVGIGASLLLAGKTPPPIQLGFIPWSLRLLPLVPLLQIAGISATLRKARRGQREPQARRTPGRILGLLPLLPGLGLAATPLLLHRQGMLRYLMQFNPDLAWVTILSGTLAGVGAVLRTGMMLRTWFKPRR